LVTEGTSSNIFAWQSGELLTPIADHRILAGVTRGVVINLAADLGLRVVERDIRMPEIMSAAEVFITSMTIELMPVVSIDGLSIGSGRPSGTWDKLRSAFGELARGARVQG
jgi:D-alanine transaminase